MSQPHPSSSSAGDHGKRSKKPIAVDVVVPSQSADYRVVVGSGQLERLGYELARVLPGSTRALIVSDSNVAPLYLATAQAKLVAQGLEVRSHVVPAGEASKSVAELMALVSKLVDDGFSRDDVVVALGGGVVGDLAGLGAALFARGMAVVQVPTSLLAQVDASVGGKVAIDLPQGKNLMGTFHFPSLVLIDPDVLATLPARELSSGLAEMIKHALLFAPQHLDELLEQLEAIRSGTAESLPKLIAVSVGLKAACVSRDPREVADSRKGRVLLNLGHTVGHVLEHLSNYTITHGEAVSLGLVAAARISVSCAGAPAALESIVVEALGKAGLPTDLDEHLARFHEATLVQALGQDKKRRAQGVTYIALKDIGEPRLLTLAPSQIITLLRSPAAPC